MIYAHARASGNVTLIQEHVSVIPLRFDVVGLRGLLQMSRMIDWTEYLIGATLYTTQQYVQLVQVYRLSHTVFRESTDLLSIYNQTNLAIKGIIAIKAMSVMSDVAQQSGSYSVCALFLEVFIVSSR
jgi:hypothetical protein